MDMAELFILRKWRIQKIMIFLNFYLLNVDIYLTWYNTYCRLHIPTFQYV